jgi:hypothetical protein
MLVKARNDQDSEDLEIGAGWVIPLALSSRAFRTILSKTTFS